MRALPAVSRLRCLWTLALAAVGMAACGSNTTGPSDVNGGIDQGGSQTMMPADTSSGGVTDAEVFFRARYDSTWVFYKYSPDTLVADPTSPHQGRIRTRYNTFAATQLDSLGKVRSPADFPDQSLIAKEVYDGPTLTSIAVMIKLAGDPNAGHGEWLWGEYGPKGTVLHSITQDNGVCHNCHVRGIDHTRMNDTHP